MIWYVRSEWSGFKLWGSSYHLEVETILFNLFFFIWGILFAASEYGKINQSLVCPSFQGLGRRYIKSLVREGHPDLLEWPPVKEEQLCSGPLRSFEREMYRGVPVDRDAFKQKLVPRTHPEVGRPSNITTYRVDHSHDNPHVRLDCPFQQNKKQKYPENKDTVACCLNWYKPPRASPILKSVNCCPDPPPPEVPMSCAQPCDPSMIIESRCGTQMLPPCQADPNGWQESCQSADVSPSCPCSDPSPPCPCVSSEPTASPPLPVLRVVPPSSAEEAAWVAYTYRVVQWQWGCRMQSCSHLVSVQFYVPPCIQYLCYNFVQ